MSVNESLFALCPLSLIHASRALFSSISALFALFGPGTYALRQAYAITESLTADHALSAEDSAQAQVEQAQDDQACDGRHA